jgi:hypothetical protein
MRELWETVDTFVLSAVLRTAIHHLAPKSSNEGYPHAGVPKLTTLQDDDKGDIFSDGVDHSEPENEFSLRKGYCWT